jgi:hypothetical protein
MSNINELKFDDKNFNKHTEYGMSLLGKSLQELGAGRSILIDKDNNIIAGNGIVEAAGQVGIENVKIIETDGSEIIAVKRTDMSLNSERGREMALADNATALADIEWDEDAIRIETEKWGIDTGDWGVSLKWDEDIDEIIEKASSGSVTEYSDDVNYNLKKLFREKINGDIVKKIDDGIKNGKIRNEIAEILKTRATQCAIFNFDEIIKFYRSDDASSEEKELLERLYLVFITPKEAIEKGILEIEKTTGDIYDKNLMEKTYEETS